MLGDGGLPSGNSREAESRGAGLTAPQALGRHGEERIDPRIAAVGCLRRRCGIALCFRRCLSIYWAASAVAARRKLVRPRDCQVQVRHRSARRRRSPHLHKRRPRRRPLPRHAGRPAPLAIGAPGTPVPAPTSPSPAAAFEFESLRTLVSGWRARCGNVRRARPGAMDAANWKQRIPIVRIAGEANPRPGETSTPPSNPSEPQQLLADANSGATQLAENLQQITDQDSARRVAPLWAEITAKGLDNVRRPAGWADHPSRSQVKGVALCGPLLWRGKPPLRSQTHSRRSTSKCMHRRNPGGDASSRSCVARTSQARPTGCAGYRIDRARRKALARGAPHNRVRDIAARHAPTKSSILAATAAGSSTSRKCPRPASS